MDRAVRGIAALPPRRGGGDRATAAGPPRAARGQPLQRVPGSGADRHGAPAPAALHRQGRAAEDPDRRAGAPQRGRGVRAPARGRRRARPRRPGNEDAFVECHRALAKRDLVAIFPEGTTHDRAQIDPIKTGAARIALGARAAGADDVAIVPVGLTFPDKVALRSSALVQFGLPIELDVVAPDGVGSDDADAVRQLTGVIDRGIRAVSPDFPDVETALALDQAAQVALSSRDDPDPSLEERADLARRLGRASPTEQEAVRRDVGRYLTTLAGLHLTDADVIRPTNPARLLRSAFWIAVLVIVLGGLVAATAPGEPVARAPGPPRQPAREDAGVEGHGPGPRRASSRSRRRGSPPGCWPPTAPLNGPLVVAHGRGRRPRGGLDGRAGLGARVDAAPVAGAARADRHRGPGRGGARRRRRHGPPGRGHAVTASRHVAESDCEEIRPGLIGQPANTVSSLAFVAAAVPIASAARRRRQPAWAAVAAATAVEGLGSVAYHGPGGRAAKRLHDGGLVALAATLGVAVGREGRPSRAPPADRRPRDRARSRCTR